MSMSVSDNYNSLAVWSWLAAALLASQAAVLALAPRLLLFLAADSSHRTLTPLESFLALHFALFLAALALALLLNVPSDNLTVSAADTQPSPSHPLLAPLTIAANLSALLAWNTHDVGPLATVFFCSSLTIGLWGLWALVFAGSSSISKSTGADKHTSAFLFGNKSAASEQKKRLRKGEQQ
ncbi:hypothetical protein B0H34DRAFT_795071 [Crassisporium funariophilum]|nr:hypothetical protein B0H34DRAFT_795071 [Crassisporium funariophilum]